MGGIVAIAARTIPPLLLVGIASFQLWLARSAHLTAWCGGGFGMFSTIDGWGARHLHATLIGAGWRQELVVPRALERLAQEALAFPDDTRLRALAHALSRHGDVGAAGEAQRVEVVVFARRFSADLAPAGERIGALELTIGEP
ncbi:MAG TPA: hypothetical protein VFT98_08430 [Myxococcota bacterium]|nr:hypothetical protein [Myxococcota bacterium]